MESALWDSCGDLVILLVFIVVLIMFGFWMIFPFFWFYLGLLGIFF